MLLPSFHFFLIVQLVWEGCRQNEIVITQPLMIFGVELARWIILCSLTSPLRNTAVINFTTLGLNFQRWKKTTGSIFKLESIFFITSAKLPANWVLRAPDVDIGCHQVGNSTVFWNKLCIIVPCVKRQYIICMSNTCIPRGWTWPPGSAEIS